MSHYARFSRRGKPFLALTGYTLEEFQALLPAFRSCYLKRMEYYTLKGKQRGKRCYVEYCNSPLPTMEDKLVFILMYLRKATTQDIFGEVFNMPQPVANKWIHILHPCLNHALAELGEKPARNVAELHLTAEAGQLFFQDGTERPIQRPKKNGMRSRTMCWSIHKPGSSCLPPPAKARSTIRKSQMRPTWPCRRAAACAKILAFRALQIGRAS